MTTDRVSEERIARVEARTHEHPDGWVAACGGLTYGELRALLSEVRASRAAATTGDPDARVKKGFRIGIEAAAKLALAERDGHEEDALVYDGQGTPRAAERARTRASACQDVATRIRALAPPPPGSAAPGVVEIAEVQRVPMPWESTAREDGAAAPCDECGRVASDEERLRHAFRPGLCNNPGGWAPLLDREALTTCGACGSRAPAPGAAPATASPPSSVPAPEPATNSSNEEGA